MLPKTQNSPGAEWAWKCRLGNWRGCPGHVGKCSVQVDAEPGQRSHRPRPTNLQVPVIVGFLCEMFFSGNPFENSGATGLLNPEQGGLQPGRKRCHPPDGRHLLRARAQRNLSIWQMGTRNISPTSKAVKGRARFQSITTPQPHSSITCNTLLKVASDHENYGYKGRTLKFHLWGHTPPDDKPRKSPSTAESPPGIFPVSTPIPRFHFYGERNGDSASWTGYAA